MQVWFVRLVPLVARTAGSQLGPLECRTKKKKLDLIASCNIENKTEKVAANYYLEQFSKYFGVVSHNANEFDQQKSVHQNW